MNRKSTILWRLAVIGLFASLLPIGIYALERHNLIDTESMLDVSVSIRTMSHVTVDKFGDSVWEINNGSGFLVSTQNCEVWTNQHVIADAAMIEVYPRGWHGTAGIPARVINATPRHDIAILELERCDGMPQAVLGNSDELRAGDESFAVGNPLGRNPDSISRGIISHTQRFRDGGTPYLQTDAAINPGNSGGALFDRQGRVIGINSAIDTSRYGTNLGVGFAVPINLVMQTVAELRRGPPSWGDAGLAGIVSTLTPDEAEIFRVPGGAAALVVTRAPESGPGQGKLEAHDAIYRIDGAAVENTEQATRLVGQRDAGDRIELELIRQGQPLRVAIVLGEGWQGDETPAADEYDGYLGLTLEMWGEAEGDRGKFKQPVITRVHSLGPAHRARISSSQNSMVVRGPYFMPYLLDVKTVTGIVYEGEFHPVARVEEVEALAARAYREGNPLLLEIQYWARNNPTDPKAELAHEETAFFKLMPQRAVNDVADPGLRRVLGRGVSRPPFEITSRAASAS